MADAGYCNRPPCRGLCVRVLVTTVNPAKTDEPIEMPFGAVSIAWALYFAQENVEGGSRIKNGKGHFKGVQCTRTNTETHLPWTMDESIHVHRAQDIARSRGVDVTPRCDGDAGFR